MLIVSSCADVKNSACPRGGGIVGMLAQEPLSTSRISGASETAESQRFEEWYTNAPRSVGDDRRIAAAARPAHRATPWKHQAARRQAAASTSRMPLAARILFDRARMFIAPLDYPTLAHRRGGSYVT